MSFSLRSFHSDLTQWSPLYQTRCQRNHIIFRNISTPCWKVIYPLQKGSQIIAMYLEWMKAVYLNALKLTGESHLQSFQFKPNHIIRYTNKLIMKCETFHSTFCNDTVEDLEHLFWTAIIQIICRFTCCVSGEILIHR